MLVSTNFKWVRNGPIQRFFETNVQSDFFRSSFDGAGEIRIFLSGMLSRDANAESISRIKHLTREISELIMESETLPTDECFGTSLVIAMRPWEVNAFNDLRRSKNLKVY